MQISVTGKHMDIGEALKQHIHEHLPFVTDKYFDRTIDANVVISKQGAFFRSDITVLVGTGTGMVIKATGQNDDPYVAFDSSTSKIGKQLRRYKRRIRDHHNLDTASAAEIINGMEYVVSPEDEAAEATTQHPPVIAEMKQPIQTMAVSDAVMRMDLSDASVYFFRNSGNGNLNAVYRRNDGNIGWIDPGLKTA
jgi:ribosomal subunit interface protein